MRHFFPALFTATPRGRMHASDSRSQGTIVPRATPSAIADVTNLAVA